MKTLRAISTAELNAVAESILNSFPGRRIFVFEGKMGAGKTTLIKECCRRLGVVDNTSSPTFSLVNEYHTAGGEVIYHFDFYRINDPAEAMDMGVEEYFSSGRYCFIEWPEKIPALIPPGHVRVRIQTEGETRRFVLEEA